MTARAGDARAVDAITFDDPDSRIPTNAGVWFSPSETPELDELRVCCVGGAALPLRDRDAEVAPMASISCAATAQQTRPRDAGLGLLAPWREDARVDLRRGVLVAAKPTTLREFAGAWLAGALDGSIRNRSGDRYKPSSLRGYEQALREYVMPEIGAAKLQQLRRNDIQRLADELARKDLRAATVRNALLPLRAVCRRALARGDIQVNPTTGIEIAAVRSRRMRFATPTEAQILIDNAPAEDRVLWATAFYAGLRRGELQALRWSDVDLPGGLLRVERSWDVKTGVIEPKSTAGRRKVPIAAVLRDYIAPHRMARQDGLAFGRTDGTVRHLNRQSARENRVETGRAPSDHLARVPTHVR